MCFIKVKYKKRKMILVKLTGGTARLEVAMDIVGYEQRRVGVQELSKWRCGVCDVLLWQVRGSS